MADDTRNANVVISADVSGYTQGTQQATKDTNLLIQSVNKLSTSLDGITKRAGKKLLLFTAADLAALTAINLVTARYEKQLSTLRAQTEISNKSLNAYKKGIDQLSTSIPVARGELVQLVTQIQDLGVTSEQQVLKITAVFSKMGAATGESVSELANGLITLSRTMGTLTNGAAGLENFSDQVVTLSSKMGVASTSVLAFAQNISPFARAASIGQKEILSLSAAFVKAGADSNAAATAFNTIVRDLTLLTQTGSPEIAKYSNAVGMTIDQFKDLSSVEQFVEIIDAVTRAGDKGVQMLNSMGIDGIRTARALAQLSQQAGGLRNVLGVGDEAYGNNNTQKASDKAWNSMADQMTRTRNIMEKLTSDIGDYTLPAATSLLKVFNDIASSVATISGPLLGLAGILAGVTAAFTGVAGSLLTMMGPLSTLMLAMTLFRLSPMRTFFSGLGDAVHRTRGDIAPLSRAGQMIGQGVNLPWYQRGPYAAGAALGRGVGHLPAGAAAGFRTLGTLSMQTVGSLASSQSQWYDNARKPWWERQSTVFSTPDQAYSRSQVWGAVRQNPGAFLGGLFGRNNPLLSAASAADRAQAAHFNASRVQGDVGQAAYAKTFAATGDSAAASAAAVKASNGMSASLRTAAESTSRYARTLVAARGSQAALSTAAAGAARSLIGMSLASGRFGMSMGAQAVAAPFRMLGGLVGGGAVAGLSLAAIGGAAYGIKQSWESRGGTYDGTPNVTAINTELGRATESLSEFSYATERAINQAGSLADAMRIAADSYRNQPKEEYTDKRVEGLPENQRIATDYLKSLGVLDRDQMALAIGDLSKRFAGTSVNIEELIQQYNKTTDNGTKPYDRHGLGVQMMIGGYNQTVTESRGWMQQLLGQVPEEARNILGIAMNRIPQEAATYAGKSTKYGLPLTGMVEATRTMQALDSASYQANTGPGTGVAGIVSGDTSAVQGVLNNLAKRFGGDELFGMGKMEFMNAMEEGGVKKVLKIIAGSDSDAAKAFTKMMSLAVNPNQLVSIIRASNRAEKEDLGSLATFEKNNKNVQSAGSLGDFSAAPNVIQNAYRDIAQYLTNTSDDAAEIAARTRTLMNDLDPAGRQFALNKAAEQYAIERQVYGATINGGAMAGVAEQYKANINKIKFSTNVGTEQEEQENFQITQDTRQKAAEYYLFVKNFYRQRVYAAQDFARQLKYASEDAAKSLYDPFTRPTARGSQSSGMVASNMERQMKMMKDQVKNLDILRKRGLSQEAIDNMNLADVSSAYMVQRWVDEGASFDAKGLNKYGGKARTTAAGKLVEETSQFERAQENYDISMERGVKNLQLYGEEVMGNTTKIISDTASLLGTLNIKNTDYLEKLTELAEVITGKSPDAGSATIKDQALIAKPGDTVDFGKTRYDQTGMTMTSEDLGSVKVKKTNSGNWVAIGASGSKIPIPDDWYEWSKKDKELWFKSWSRRLNGTNGGTPLKNWSGTDVSGYAKEKKEKKDPDEPFWADSWNAVNGLAEGGIATRATKRVFGEAGPEAVIPLNATGTAVLSNALRGSITMDLVKGMRTSGYGSVPSYKGDGTTIVNKNTQFMGPITVQAQDPNEMARKLESKKKLANMRKGANASI